MTRLLALYSGSAAEARTFSELRYRNRLGRVAYTRDAGKGPGGAGVSPASPGGAGVSPASPGGAGVSPASLGGAGVSPAGLGDDVDGVWVPEGTPRRRLTALAPRLERLLQRGGTVLLFGDQQAGWPASVRWSYRPVGGAGQTTIPTNAHGFATRVGEAATALHHHGVVEAPSGSCVLLAAADGSAVAYLDRQTTPGTLLVTTLDPLSHFGTTGAPDAGRFLDAFLPWVCDMLLAGGDRP